MTVPTSPARTTLSEDERRAIQKVVDSSHDRAVRRFGTVRFSHKDVVALEQVLIRAGVVTPGRPVS